MATDLPSDWAVLPLDECMAAIIDYRGKTPRKSLSGVPLVTAKVVKGGRILQEPREFIAESDYDAWMRRGLPQAGDVVITTEAPMGEVAQLDGSKVALAQRLITLRGRPDLLHNTYLRYHLQARYVQDQLRARSTGTTVLGFKQSELRKVSLAIPPLPEQHAIARVLGSLDDKIELNRQMNETLEAMARAIFKSWFVDFDPVRAKAEGHQPAGMDAATAALFPDAFEETELGEVPKGWEVSTIGHVAEVTDCLHSKKPVRQDEGPPLLQLPNIRDDGLIDMQDTYCILRTDYERWTSRIEAGEGDCVITNVGRVGAVAQLPPGLKAALGRNMTAIRCRPDFPYPTFLIESLLSAPMRREILMRTDEGTILSALNVRSVPALRLPLPPDGLLKRHERMCRPLRAATEHNLSEASTLAVLRNTLQPKLLSGELRIDDPEAFLARVTSQGTEPTAP